jgi:hypothetical protein
VIACSLEITTGIKTDESGSRDMVAKRKAEPQRLKGWQEIANFLGQTTSVAQRWAKSGMPAIHEGRRVYAVPDELNRWLGREAAGEPVQIATGTADLSAELKRGLSYVRKHGRVHRGNAA